MFATTATLKQHNHDVHTKNVKCECCDKTIAKKAHLKRHLQGVENKPVQNDTEDKEEEKDFYLSFLYEALWLQKLAKGTY